MQQRATRSGLNAMHFRRTTVRPSIRLHGTEIAAPDDVPEPFARARCHVANGSCRYAQDAVGGVVMPISTKCDLGGQAAEEAET